MIFFSLLPMIITPLVGSLILFWMIDSDGIIGATLQNLFNDPTLSLQGLAGADLGHRCSSTASGPMRRSRFVVFYAGLQTVPGDTLEIGDDRRRLAAGSASATSSSRT